MCFISSYLGDNGVWWDPELLSQNWSSFHDSPSLSKSEDLSYFQNPGHVQAVGEGREHPHSNSVLKSSSSGRYIARMLELEKVPQVTLLCVGPACPHLPVDFTSSWSCCPTFLWLFTYFLGLLSLEWHFLRHVNLTLPVCVASLALSYRRCSVIICRINTCKKIEAVKWI